MNLRWLVAALLTAGGGLGQKPAMQGASAPEQDQHSQQQDSQRRRSQQRAVANHCRAAVQRKAEQQFQTKAIVVEGVGRGEKALSGTLQVQNGPHQGERFQFSCSVYEKSDLIRGVGISGPIRDNRIIVDPW